MSADDWLQCPVCLGVPEPLKNGYKHFYGKVDEIEYNRLKELYENGIESTPVRVYYEHSINADLSISFDFAAECDLCHAKWRHQVKQAVLADFSTKELVDELRKREGVEAYDVPVEGEYQIRIYSSRRIQDDSTQLADIVDSGPATILRVID